LIPLNELASSLSIGDIHFSQLNLSSKKSEIHSENTNELEEEQDLRLL